MAEAPAATNFTFHGVNADSSTLSESATWTDHGLDVNSFNSTSHDGNLSHVFEDEPDYVYDDSTGAVIGNENYHKDETYEADLDATGSGSYVGGYASADYQVTETGSMAAHNVLTSADESTGTDADGNPYDVTFNYTGDRTTNGLYTNVYNYHDENDGSVLVNTTYTGADNSAIAYHDWGVNTGQAFDETASLGESGGLSFSFAGTGAPIASDILPQVYPFAANASNFLLAYGETDEMVLTQFVPGPLVKAPQAYYNKKIQAIGEDAKKKVGKIFLQQETMRQITAGDPNNPAVKHATGTFTVDGKSNHAFAQAVGLGSDLDKAEKKAKEYGEAPVPKGAGWTGVSVNVNTQCTYAVQPRPGPGKDRSGKCVVQYTIRVTYTGKDKNGKTQTATQTILGDSAWFIDDNLKTTDLVEDP